MTFTEPARNGRQQMTVRFAEGHQSLTGIDGVLLGAGPTGEVLRLANGGSAWFGEVGDPFWGDGIALAQFPGDPRRANTAPTCSPLRPATSSPGAT